MTGQRTNTSQGIEKSEAAGPLTPQAVGPIAAAASGTFDLMTIIIPADDALKAEQQDECVTMELYRIFRGRLSRAEMNLFASLGDPKHDLQGEARLWDKLDEVLIDHAASLGWRLYLSRVVRARIAIWTDRGDPRDMSGIDKLKRFHASMNRYAETKRGLKRLPLTEPEWYHTRKNALGEIKALQKKLTARFANSRNAPNVTEIYAAIRAEIGTGPKEYRYLSANLTSFWDYLEKQDSPSVLITNQVPPAVILDGWFDYQGCTPAAKSRQIISRLGNQRQRRSR